MRHLLVLLTSLLIGVATACTPDDRCGDKFEYSDGVCVPLDELDSNTAANIDTTVLADSATASDSGKNQPAPGASCTADDQSGCDGLNDYCAVNPIDGSGYCTQDECTVGGNDCPQGFTCCAMTGSTDRFCMADDDFSAIGSVACGG